MKKVIAAAILLVSALSLQAQGWYRQPTPNDTLKSVRVQPDGKVLFQIYAPKATEVAVTGDLPWDKPVKFQKNMQQELNLIWDYIYPALSVE